MRRKVFVALRMSGIAGQEKLSGIFRYLGDEPEWDITLIRTAEAFTPDRIHDALRQRYDGFIISIPDTEPTAALLAQVRTPTVVMDIHDPALTARRRNITFIRNSAEEIGHAAADHLLAIGKYRTYAFVHNPSVMQWSIARCQAYAATLKDNGHWCHVVETPEQLGGLARPLAVFAANDDRGYDVIDYCRRHRLRVPEDVAVLGINNDTLICENCHPKLSSIQPDFEQEGYLAAQALDRMMRTRTEQDTPRTIHVGVRRVVRRESTAELSHAGRLVQRALAFIHTNALKGISVADVAAHLKVSRRLADLRFRELQGTTIGETIIQTRLEEVKQRLRTTNATIESIAADCGYANTNYLKNLFRKRYAMSIRDFRNQAQR